MKKINIICAGLAFLMILIAAYFGSAIHNSKSNDIIAYLNEMDHIHYYDVELIPQLNFKAAVFTIPLLFFILVAEIYIAIKAKIKRVKTIATVLSIAIFIVFIIAILILNNPFDFQFDRFGYIWIAIGFFTIVGNMVSVFSKGNT